MTTTHAPAVLAPADQRVAAFCSHAGPEVFHAIVHQPQIWKADPFDVEAIHARARDAFERLLTRAAMVPRPEFGKVLLLQGEAGSGKTHLMRAFRNRTHGGGCGYCGYLQMTSQSNNYARYVLSNLIDALDQPYDADAGPTSGLMRLALGLLESLPLVSAEERQQFRDGLVPDLSARVESYADQAISDTRFEGVELDLIRAMLYVLRDDPRIKSRVLPWLRCEDLAPGDRAMLGGLVPRIQEEAPLKMLTQIGRLMAAVQEASLVLLVDQLEEITNQDAAVERFRKVVDTLVAVTNQVPTSVVVIACLEDYFQANRQHLSKSKLDRIELDPAPIRLTERRTAEDVEAVLGQRLRYLYEELGAPFDEKAPAFPFTPAHLAELAGLRLRDVLDHCRRYRERCADLGKLAKAETSNGDDSSKSGGKKELPETKVVVPFEQTWNDYLAAFKGLVPDAEPGLAHLLAWAIRDCSPELPDGHWFAPETEPNSRMVPVEAHAPGNAVDRLLVAVCDKGTQGGGLGRQITEVERRASETRIAIVRSTAFPTNPAAAVCKQIGKLIGKGGRRVVVENSEWRRMLALQGFHQQHGTAPEYATWQRASKPLTQLHAMREVLALDRLPAAKTTAPPPASPPPPKREVAPPPKPQPAASTPTSVPAPLFLGTTRTAVPAPVHVQPDELRQHAAFLGGSGSGKTTAALTLIEQLLLRGVPAVLVDRKGDLCGYADPAAWQRPLNDPAREATRLHLRHQLDVAVFTPGEVNGRPLSIPVVPAGIDTLPTADRDQMSGYAAAALASMIGLKPRGGDAAQIAILRKAIDVLGSVPGGTVTVPLLLQLIGEQDETLLNAIGGGYDARLYKKLAEVLLTFQIQQRHLLEGNGEALDIDSLLGVGKFAVPGKTRLSVISTRFLGDATVDFWVAQLLLNLSRWIGKRPSGELQAVFLFDEADQYLPATRQPATKAPMENLLRRARSAGVGLFLATQSPGDFDYKCRDTIRTWLVGRVKEAVALNKLKPMFSESKIDVAAKLPTQGTGQFYLMREKEVCGLQTQPSFLTTEQLPEDRILELARLTRQREAVS